MRSSDSPRGAHWGVEKTVGLVVVDEHFLVRIVMELSSQTDGQVGQVENGSCADEPLQGGLLLVCLFDGLSERKERLGVGHGLDLFLVFFRKVIERYVALGLRS